MRRIALVVALATLGCKDDTQPVTDDTGPVVEVDEDGDGSPADVDCDDANPDVYPGQTETPYDGVDNDCDEGTPDDDLDGDGYPQAQDCDDQDANLNPGEIEVCDGVDNNCNGQVDDAAGGIFYADADGDGFGDPDVTAQSCEGNEGYVADNSDCDDGNAAVNLLADEYCDGIDNDCDGATDEPQAVDAATWYADADSDGHGTVDTTTESCDQPEGFVAGGEDCDDSNPQVSPNAVEFCNGYDDNCDGETDEDTAFDVETFYADFDGDGYGNAAYATDACDAPAGYVDDDTDCDDTEAGAYPGATETCDEVDNDCDRDVDEGVTFTYAPDYDGDGYGDDSGRYEVEACSQPAGFVSDASDCDDSDSSANPGETEACDEVDNDCDSSVDEGVTSTWYLDADGDGYGRDSSTVDACAAPTSAYAALGGDCDDNDTAFNPGETPGCDGNDYDCDGSVDNDADADGYSDIACGGTDCDDSDPNILPEAAGGCALGTDCLDIYNSGYTTDDEYTIDPDGYGTGVDPVDVWCEMTFNGGGWTSVFNYMDPGGSSTTDAANFHAALINNADMNSPVLPTDTSASIYTSNLDLSQYTEVVYGWAASSTDDVSRYGTYTDASGLSGECYLDGYCGANVAIASMDILPTGNNRTIYTGNQPTYPHVGMGFSGQIILWGYDRNNSSYGNWANWYDLNSCCNAGNTSAIQTSGWRYVIYIR
ncbi:MAG: hypothetical protein H6739_20420 [Alphaproteobacteria bacterium]|nr:hypothetical protein [Alphaproteobacteria bacterium]